MIRIEVKGVDHVQAKLSRIQLGMQGRAMQLAINKVAGKARAEINRAIPQEFAVKLRDLRNAIYLRRARSGSLEAVLSIFGSARRLGRSLNLIHFLQTVIHAGQQVKLRGTKGNRADMRALNSQLGFRIKKSAGMKVIEGAFVGNKGRTIFRRTGSARLPIEPLQVIGFSQMFRSRRVEQRVLSKIHTELPIEIDRAIKKVLS